jgi:hypothetical protein
MHAAFASSDEAPPDLPTTRLYRGVAATKNGDVHWLTLWLNVTG